MIYMKKKVNKETKNQILAVIERCENQCSIEEMMEEAKKSDIKASDVVVEEYILLPNGELVIK